MAKTNLQKELTAKMGEIKPLVKNLNEAMEFAEFKKVSGIRASINEKVGEYNELAQKCKFAELAKSPDPMQQACIDVYYTGIRVKDDPDADKKLPVKPQVIDEVSLVVDLVALHNFVIDTKKSANGIGHSSTWNIDAEKLNILYTADAVKAIGKDPTVVITKAARSKAALNSGFDWKVEDLAKHTSEVVAEMIGGGHTVPATMIETIRRTHLRRGKEITILKANRAKSTVVALMAICHCLLTNDEFEIGFKQMKEKSEDK